jgi:SNF2 family DNA or RNA helicase
MTWRNHAFALFANHVSSMDDAHALRHFLFVDHAPSYYGLFIRCAKVADQYVVLVPAWHALTWLADERRTAAQKVTWHGDLLPETLHDLARTLLSGLRAGRFVPDFERWRQGEFGFAADPMWAHEQSLSDFARQWFAAALDDLNEDVDVAAHWQRLTDAQPLLTATKKKRAARNGMLFLDAAEWLAAIRWRAEQLAVRFGLQLLEPAEEGSTHWTLEVIVQALGTVDWFTTERFLRDHQASWNEAQHSEWRERWLRWEAALMQWIPAVSMFAKAEDGNRYVLSEQQAWQFLSEWVASLPETVYVLMPEWWSNRRRRPPRLHATLRRSAEAPEQSLFGLDQLLQFDWRVALADGVELTEQQFLQYVREKRKWLKIAGRWYVFSEGWVREIREQLEQHRRQGGLSLADLLKKMMTRASLDAQSDDEERTDDAQPTADAEPVEQVFELAANLRRHLDVLLRKEQLPLLAQAHTFQGALYGYQQYGVSWLLFLRQLGMGACLADDMGLGKTIQLIAYVLYLKEEQAGLAPALFVCPHSVLGNWQRELQAFAPSLRVYTHHGNERLRREQFVEHVATVDVVLTTYSLIDPDFAAFSPVEWSLICLDEAQNIKNPSTLQAQAVRKLRAQHRVAMTGTPIENRLSELWSIFDFLNPLYLGSLEQYNKTFVRKAERQKDRGARQRLKALIHPFLLRRVKKDPHVQLSLPEKHEVRVYVQMTTEQTALYEEVRSRLIDELQAVGKKLEMGAVLKTILRYKQICDHPELLQKGPAEEAADTAQRSNKLLRLLEMVEEIHARGERCIIFTQYVEMGKMIVRELKKRLHARDIHFLDGSVKKRGRDEMIAAFQQADSLHPVLVLMIRAGGVGINLTAANHVFHYDRWWNPAVENQATDRVYRIGQTRDVTVYKLITTGTIEEKIDQLLREKAELAETMLQADDEDMLRKLSLKDWERLLL